MTFFYLPSLNSWLLHFKKTSFWKSPSRKSEGPDNCVVNLQWRQHLVDTTVVDRFVLNRFLVFCFFFVCLFVFFWFFFLRSQRQGGRRGRARDPVVLHRVHGAAAAAAERAAAHARHHPAAAPKNGAVRFPMFHCSRSKIIASKPYRGKVAK